ncbi:amidase [Sinorhizobium meliloti]|nr:amidase [Sinorhizobium meliloti]
MTALENLSIRKLAAMVRAREISAVDVTTHFLGRIVAYDDALCGFNVPAPEAALDAAHDLDTYLNAGGEAGALAGIPLSIKDTADVAGLPSAGASASRSGRTATADATVVARMKAAGGIVLGKANCHELAFGGPSFDLPFPPARNPWNLDRFPGGSSSGSGVTLAAGLCLGSLATDTAGSIRLPATMCGVFGLKPGHDTLPLDGIAVLAATMDHVGPVARTADDTRILFDVMAGRSPGSPFVGSLKGLRIGVPENEWDVGRLIHPDVRAAIDGAIEVARSEGADIVPLRLPSLEDFHAPGTVLMMCEVAAEHAASVRAAWDKFGAIFRARALVGEGIAVHDFRLAERLRPVLRKRLLDAMSNVDCLLVPGALAPPGPLASVDPFYFMKDPIPNIVANYTGFPALAFPAGFGGDGMPVGVQIMGVPRSEHRLLDIAESFERADPSRFAARTPPRLEGRPEPCLFKLELPARAM